MSSLANIEAKNTPPTFNGIDCTDGVGNNFQIHINRRDVVLVSASTWSLSHNSIGQDRNMQWVPVVSTDVARIGYDDGRQILAVEFGRGRTYFYEYVPRDVFDGFLNTSSPGQWFRQVVLNQYPFSRVLPGLALVDDLEDLTDDVEEFEADF